jgi:hypothetical protein
MSVSSYHFARSPFLYASTLWFFTLTPIDTILIHLNNYNPEFYDSHPWLEPLVNLFLLAMYLCGALFVAGPRATDLGLPRLAGFGLLALGLNVLLAIMFLCLKTNTLSKGARLWKNSIGTLMVVSGITVGLYSVIEYLHRSLVSFHFILIMFFSAIPIFAGVAVCLNNPLTHLTPITTDGDELTVLKGLFRATSLIILINAVFLMMFPGTESDEALGVWMVVDSIIFYILSVYDARSTITGVGTIGLSVVMVLERVFVGLESNNIIVLMFMLIFVYGVRTMILSRRIRTGY